MKTWHWITLAVLTLATLVAEFTALSGYDAHWWNAIPGFYIIWGFIGCVLIVVVSKWIGYALLFRREDYYDR
jgi:hypothetical protein